MSNNKEKVFIPSKWKKRSLFRSVLDFIKLGCYSLLNGGSIMEAKQVGFTDLEISNGFYKTRDEFANTLEHDLSLRVLVTLPHEILHKFFLECPRIQKHLNRVSFRVKKTKKPSTFVCYETLK